MSALLIPCGQDAAKLAPFFSNPTFSNLLPKNSKGKAKPQRVAPLLTSLPSVKKSESLHPHLFATP
jgi:hypothetical protein